MQLGAVTYNPVENAFEALALDVEDGREMRIPCHYDAPINTPLSVAVKGLLTDARRKVRRRPRLAAFNRAPQTRETLIFPDYPGRPSGI